MQEETNKPILTGKQKKYLRRLGHNMDSKVIVGRDGLTENLIL